MKRFILLVNLLGWGICVNVAANIVEIETLNQLIPYFHEEIAVWIDLDDTVITNTSSLCRGSDKRDRWIEKTSRNSQKMALLLEKFYETYIPPLSTYLPTEKETLKVLADAQKQCHSLNIITLRPSEECSIVSLLIHWGICCTQLENSLNGVVFTNWSSKGEALKQIYQSNPTLSKKILFIDDKKENCLDCLEVCSELDLDLLVFWYRGSQHRFREEAAQIEWDFYLKEGEILNDEQAILPEMLYGQNSR